MKESRNYMLGDTITPEPSNYITTKVNFISKPSASDISVTGLKYNKRNWIGIDFDDVGEWVMQAFDVTNQYSYSDGCGNNINYAASICINAAHELTGIEYKFDQGLTVAMILDMVNRKRWDITDHGYYHDPVGFGENMTPLESTIRMEDYVKRMFDYWVRTKATPQNYPGHAEAAFLEHYLYVTSQGTFDSFTPEWEYAPPGDFSKVDKSFGAIRRDFTDQWQSDLGFLKEKIDLLFTKQNCFYRIASHTVDPEYFGQFCAYIQSNANDEVLLCATREVFEFEEMKRQQTTYEVVDNSIIIKTSLEGLSIKNKFKDMSFLVSSGNQILSIESNADSKSFNNNGLINILKQ